ncbi:MAG: Clp1/GlmU family protein [Gammaproteobacteria bacterium]
MPEFHQRRQLSALPLDVSHILSVIPPHHRRILLFGPMGVGKSTLASEMAKTLAQQQVCWGLNADPGTPAFGVPGAVSLARWQADSWQVQAHAALCSLDAGRFRLALVTAACALLAACPDQTVLIDTPGVVRGVAGRELLQALVDLLEVDTVLALAALDQAVPLEQELCALPADVYVIHTSNKTMRPGKRARARQRTKQWDAWLANGHTHQLDITGLNLLGTPPPQEETHSWIGRQVALLQGNRTLAMGEVRALADHSLSLQVAGTIQQADSLLLRDAQRNSEGWLETAAPFATEAFRYLPPADVIPAMAISGGPRLCTRVGALDVALINGVFGDPLLHVRLRHLRRSLLFDLGDGSRLSAHIAHQVSDVFISHAHFDHIGGFLWLLRSRLGDYPACRLYGPPGLAQHIQGFIQGILWDRIADRGPQFEIVELHGERLQHFHLQAGQGKLQVLSTSRMTDGIVLAQPGFRVRACSLDHHGTPVIAYALLADKQLNIRKDRLQARGLSPGPWLDILKQQLLQDNTDALIQLPDGQTASVAALAEDLVIITPGKKLAYATDLADTPDNRYRLIALAKNAHTFFCEAPFMETEVEHASRNGHLTTRACGEIASAAGVARLVPFHFSRRYADHAQSLFEEIERYCPQVLLPKAIKPGTTTANDAQHALELSALID